MDEFILARIEHQPFSSLWKRTVIIVELDFLGFRLIRSFETRTGVILLIVVIWKGLLFMLCLVLRFFGEI